jgi:hypothetical protein
METGIHIGSKFDKHSAEIITSSLLKLLASAAGDEVKKEAIKALVSTLKRMRDEMLYKIGEQVQDEDGTHGIVVIRYDDGDICEYENDAAHPNPKVMDSCVKKPLSRAKDAQYAIKDD